MKCQTLTVGVSEDIKLDQNQNSTRINLRQTIPLDYSDHTGNNKGTGLDGPSAGRNLCSDPDRSRPVFVLVGVQQKPRERAVLVVVPSVSFPSVQLHVNLIPRVQVQDGAVTGGVVVLVGVLSDGAGSDLRRNQAEFRASSERTVLKCQEGARGAGVWLEV